MNSKKITDLLRAFKSGDYGRLQEVKDMVSKEDYETATDLFSQYGDKSEEEILDKLASIKDSVPNHEELISRIKPFLNQEQLSKLDKVVDYLNNQD